MDRYDYYIQILQDRDQALLLLAGLVLSGMLWWSLLERWPRGRRAIAWACVVLYFAVMVLFLMGGRPIDVI